MSYDRRRPPDVESLISVKVDNLSYRTTADQLKRAFDKFGEIGDVYIPRDPYGHEASRGFGFVRFYDSRDADDAVHAMDGVMLNGREIRVQLARHNRSHRSDFVGSRSRRNYSRRSHSRSRSRSRSRNRRRRSRSSSRDHCRRRSRSRSHNRKKSRSRSRNSKKRNLSRSRTKSRSRSPKRHRPDENGNKLHDDTKSLNTNDSTKNLEDLQNNNAPQLDIPTCDENSSVVEMENSFVAQEEQSERDTSALKDDATHDGDDGNKDGCQSKNDESNEEMNVSIENEFTKFEEITENTNDSEPPIEDSLEKYDDNTERNHDEDSGEKYGQGTDDGESRDNCDFPGSKADSNFCDDDTSNTGIYNEANYVSNEDSCSKEFYKEESNSNVENYFQDAMRNEYDDNNDAGGNECGDFNAGECEDDAYYEE